MAPKRTWQEMIESIVNLNDDLQQRDLFARIGRSFTFGRVLSPARVADPLAAFGRAIRTQRFGMVTPTVDWLQPIRQASGFGLALNPLAHLGRTVLEPFRKLSDHLRTIPRHTQEAVILLGKHGWYLDLELRLPDLWRLRTLLSEGNVSHANELLTEHFSARLDEIEDYLKGRLPNRGHIIEAAFTAHRNEHHLLSVPVILAQVDGVCKELAGQYFFSRRAGKPQTAAYVAQFTPGTFRSAMLSAFAELLPVTASESERGPNFDNLNRHMILHGESLDYGSRINGLKAISLLNYVASMLQPDEETGEVTVPDSTGLSTEDDLA